MAAIDEERDPLFHDTNRENEQGDTVYELSEKITTREDFVVFLKALHRDFIDESEKWENLTIEMYLESMSAFVNSAQPRLEDNATWKTFGVALRTARIYE